MHTININDDTYHLPSNWNELTIGQLRYLVKITSSDMPMQEIQISMMLYCLEAHVCRHKEIYHDRVRVSVGQQSDKVLFKVRHKKYMLHPIEVNILSDLFAFLVRIEKSNVNSSNYQYFINPELTNNPLPTLRCRLQQFTGPDDELLDINFEQYMYVQTYLDAMPANPEHIDHLLACLWHRKKEFDINRLERDAQILHHLPSDIKMILYWYVLSSLNSLSDSFPRVFSGGGKTNGRVFESQMRLLDSLAQSDMTKKPEVRKGYLIDALYSMDESIRRKEESQENYQNA